MPSYGSSDSQSLLAQAVSGAATQLSMATDLVFETGDLVFMDLASGDLAHNRNMPSVSAMVLGPNIQSFPFAEYTDANSRTVAGNSTVGPDGTLYLLMAAGSGGSATSRALMAQKIDQKGNVLNKNILGNDVAGSAVAFVEPRIALLTNGNVLCTFTDTGSTTTIQYALLGPSLRLITRGFITPASSGNSSVVQHIQPTSTGGAILFTANGIEFISALGVSSRPVTQLLSTLSYQDSLRDAGAVDEVLLAPIPLKSGAPGGFGYLYQTTAVGAVGVWYAQINADGSLRGSPLQLSTTVGAALRYAVSSTSGNVLWSSIAAYGFITDAGVVVVAGANIAGASTTGARSQRIISDVSGNFMLFSLSMTDYRWNLYHFTAAGASISAGVVAGSLNSSGANQEPAFDPAVANTSGGVAFAYPSGNAAKSALYSFVTLAGAVQGGVIARFGGPGTSEVRLGIGVVGDKVFGVASNGADSTPVAIVPFSISKTGVMDSGGDSMSASSQRSPLQTANFYPRIYPDESGKSFHFVGVNAQGAWVVITFTLDLKLLTYYAFGSADSTNGPQFVGSTIRNYAQGLLLTGKGASVNQSVVFIKPKYTLLIGVAAADSVGGYVTVQTKGVFPVSQRWKLAARAFDHTATSPPGNSGSINSNYINLKGF